MIIVDASVIIALLDARDAHHAKAIVSGDRRGSTDTSVNPSAVDAETPRFSARDVRKYSAGAAPSTLKEMRGKIRTTRSLFQ